MYDKAFKDKDFLPALKFICDCFVTGKMTKKLPTALFVDEDILFFDKDSGNVTFFSNEMVILSINLNNINLDNVNYD